MPRSAPVEGAAPVFLGHMRRETGGANARQKVRRIIALIGAHGRARGDAGDTLQQADASFTSAWPLGLLTTALPTRPCRSSASAVGWYASTAPVFDDFRTRRASVSVTERCVRLVRR